MGDVCQHALTLLLLVVYLGGGVGFYAWYEEWDVRDSLYFCVMSASTVGSGDLAPTTDASRAFTGVYIALGIVLIFTRFVRDTAGLMRCVEECVFFLFDTPGKPQRTIARAVSDGSLDGLKRRRVPDGEAFASFVPALPAPLFWSKHLICSASILILLQLGSAYMITVFGNNVGFNDALYHCWLTAATVGAGDVILPEEHSRWWACAHIGLNVVFWASLLSHVDELRGRRHDQLVRDQFVRRLLQADFTEVGKGVSKADFVMSMVISMGVMVGDRSLSWLDVEPFFHEFDRCDADSDGHLTPREAEMLWLDRKQWAHDMIALHENKSCIGFMQKSFRKYIEDMDDFGHPAEEPDATPPIEEPGVYPPEPAGPAPESAARPPAELEAGHHPRLAREKDRLPEAWGEDGALHSREEPSDPGVSRIPREADEALAVDAYARSHRAELGAHTGGIPVADDYLPPAATGMYPVPDDAARRGEGEARATQAAGAGTSAAAHVPAASGVPLQFRLESAPSTPAEAAAPLQARDLGALPGWPEGFVDSCGHDEMQHAVDRPGASATPPVGAAGTASDNAARGVQVEASAMLDIAGRAADNVPRGVQDGEAGASAMLPADVAGGAPDNAARGQAACFRNFFEATCGPPLSSSATRQARGPAVPSVNAAGRLPFSGAMASAPGSGQAALLAPPASAPQPASAPGASSSSGLAWPRFCSAPAVHVPDGWEEPPLLE